MGSPELLKVDLSQLINESVCVGSQDGSIFIDAMGGTPDYQFFWEIEPETDQQEITGLGKGTYTVRIVDANGCKTFFDVEKTERFPRLYMPNAFTPNGDGMNDTFKPVTDCELDYNFQIFNRWGRVVFTSEDIQAGWDGLINNQEAPPGQYSYVIFYAVLINDRQVEETFRGTFRLIR